MVKIHRRNFMILGAGGAAAAAAYPQLVKSMELELGGQDYHQIRTFHPREKSAFLCTMCPYFDGGHTFSQEGEILKAEGDPHHIATRGKFCSKGLSSFFAASDPDRLLAPRKRVGPRGSGKWREIGWDEAIAEVAEKIRGALDAPDSIHLNEGGFKDGGALRFMNTIGSRSVIRSRIPGVGCIPKQVALKRSFGVNFILPDFEKSKYLLNFGANIMETAFPLAQRLTDGIVDSRLKTVTFDVRMSNTAGRSDEWFPVFPGSDGIIALAMANVIMQKGLADKAFIDNWTTYSSDRLAEDLKEFTPEMAEKASGVSAEAIRRIAVEFASTKPATVFSLNGVSLHRNGIDGESACLLLAAITGNIETKGGNCLPRQFDIAAPRPAPEQPGGGPKQLTYNYAFPFEVKDGVRKVRVLLNHMSNPAYSSPAASFWREVLKDETLIPYLVDFSPFMSESAELADIILPDVVAVERHDLASSPTALHPWASMAAPAGKPRGEARDVRETLKGIVEAIDPDGSRGMKQYWAFANARDWVKGEVEATAPLKGKYKKLKSKGGLAELRQDRPDNAPDYPQGRTARGGVRRPPRLGLPDALGQDRAGHAVLDRESASRRNGRRGVRAGHLQGRLPHAFDDGQFEISRRNLAFQPALDKPGKGAGTRDRGWRAGKACQRCRLYGDPGLADPWDTPARRRRLHLGRA